MGQGKSPHVEAGQGKLVEGQTSQEQARSMPTSPVRSPTKYLTAIADTQRTCQLL